MSFAALLSADLLGFHTYDYARHFLSACSRVLEVDTTPRGLEYNSHFVSLGVYPIGIDPDHIVNILQRPTVHARIKVRQRLCSDVLHAYYEIGSRVE